MTNDLVTEGKNAMARTSLRCGAWAFALSVFMAAPQPGHAADGILKLSSTVHGIALDENNQPIVLDETNIARAQAGMIATLRAQLDKASLAQFDAAAKANADKAAGKQGDIVWANAVAIQSLIQKIQPADATTFLTQNLKLLTRYGGLVDKPVDLQDLAAGKPPSFSVLSLSGLFNNGRDTGIFGPFRPFYTYNAKCEAAGVPLPPPLNVTTPSAVWHSAGEQTVSYLEPPVQHPHKYSRMFYYIPADGSGICVANPIIEDKVAHPTSINAFGVICQSIAKPGKPSHACFWDNAVDSMPVSTTHNFSNAAEFNAPPNLPNDNQCTDCHSGSHAYIVMPGTAIETALGAYDSTHPVANFHSQNNWFTPLVQPTWPQNNYAAYPPGPSTDPNAAGSCGACHGPNGGFFGKTLPKVSGLGSPQDKLFKFCSFILPNFMTGVHDPANYYDGAMKSEAASHPAGVTALYNACHGIFLGSGKPFPATQPAWLVHSNPP